MAEIDTRTRKWIFISLVLVALVLAVTSMTLVGVWMKSYRGGFDWHNKQLVFNFHPLFMVIGIVLYGTAILVYRLISVIPIYIDRVYVKILHGGLHVGAFLLFSVGIAAVFKFHNMHSITNMYTLHSWIGLGTVILFGVQWLFGFITFLFPKLPENYRVLALPIHTYFGVAIFCLFITAAIAGITEKAIFTLGGRYSPLPKEAMILNFLGIMLVLTGLVVAYTVTRPAYNRPTETLPLMSSQINEKE